MDAVETLPLPEYVLEDAAVGASNVPEPPPPSSPNYDRFKFMGKFESALELGEVEVPNKTDLPKDTLPEEPTAAEIQPPVTSKGDEPSPKSPLKIPDPSASEKEKIQQACVGKIVFKELIVLYDLGFVCMSFG